MLLRLLTNFVVMVTHGRLTRRALAAAVKLCGSRLERRWPFVVKAEGQALNLGFVDVLEFQYARSRDFTALVIGAYDGMTNDPSSEFIRSRNCRAVFVEPQIGPFERLCAAMLDCPRVEFLNAAIDEKDGVREFYYVPPGVDGLPSWTEQLASFDMAHLLKHEIQAPGLSKHIATTLVNTVSFAELLGRYGLNEIDLLQIDAEGMDAKLLSWFPFHVVKPAVLHYETQHMTADELEVVHAKLKALGYIVRISDSNSDDMAVLF